MFGFYLSWALITFLTCKYISRREAIFLIVRINKIWK
jgi:hypothetical protein